MSFSKRVAVAAALALALQLILASHLAAAGAKKDETIAPLQTCETMIKVPCWGKNAICIPICIAMRYTGGFCDVATCMCTKQCLAAAEAEADGASQQAVATPRLN
ncbi:uncharacterized protein LOC100279046 precursor [Zea mays]|uniref:Uncharacterized protein n=1 Tax=Zea mays TaxID=4577 RepID=B6UH35_MAIZE|nr:uncharacterized protein LOC100279046 precursor [Zea mays]ACG48668.1 hypothetical protein [Zea mays]|eukprot:NP_001145577.1 uncharacterized protein LOC100279046 precursor [Zea mays]